MWTYEQCSGRLISRNGALAGEGYSGAREGKNNPAMQSVEDVGPIPCGKYTIDGPVAKVLSIKGDQLVYVLRLTPDLANRMFGRSGLLMHGDSLTDPGTASEGCIVISRVARELVAESTDRTLEVVSGEKAISA